MKRNIERDFSRRNMIETEILLQLELGPKTRSELSLGLGYVATVIGQKLSLLEAEGVIAKLGKEKWGLV